MTNTVAKVGDIIVAQGLEVVIEELFYSENFGTHDKPNHFVEFIDNMGNYRYWKQETDGGCLISQN